MILFEGPSNIDGKPIVVIAITRTTNGKTGDMVQTYILRQDIPPLEALATGEDVSICGDCKYRAGGPCYVTVMHGPRSVWAAYKRGSYKKVPTALIADIGRDRHVRLGTYGDPAAAPLSVWRQLTHLAAGHTGYTHQWRDARFRQWLMLCMASVDTPQEASEAQAHGFRTYRVRLAEEPVLPGEFVCPASSEAGKRLQCEDCLACDGTDLSNQRRRKASPVIIAHGSKAKRYIAMRAI